MSMLILQTAARAVFQTILVFSLFMLFAGHNAPGGGFIGGLIAASAFALLYVANGIDDLRRTVPVRPPTLLGLGLIAAGGTGVAGLVSGGQLLESGTWEGHLPVIGEVAASSVLVFDIGVFLVVVGLTLAMLETLGSEAER